MPETQDSRPQGVRKHILERIVATKRAEVERLRPRAAELLRDADGQGAPRDFEAALRRPREVALIAEVKRRSPGAGEIRPGLDAAEVARGYRAVGAAAVSVLTDREYFGGGLEDLASVREAVGLPVLRKDFVIDPLQVAEARAAGADAVLLIVRILDDALLAELLACAQDHALAALVEVHDASELERALASGARVLGVNNRDLATFTTDLDVTLRLLDRVPPETLVVSESGIRSPADVERLGGAGVHAVLVGESLLRLPPARRGAAVRALAGVRRRGP